MRLSGMVATIAEISRYRSRFFLVGAEGEVKISARRGLFLPKILPRRISAVPMVCHLADIRTFQIRQQNRPIETCQHGSNPARIGMRRLQNPGRPEIFALSGRRFALAPSY